jgi:Mn-containing catalase
VHIVAYAKALEKLSGVNVGGLLPIPDISNKQFPESRKHEEKGLHRILYRFSPNDYRQITEIWTGFHPEDGSRLEVRDGPPEGGAVPDLDEEPQLTAPMGPDGPDPEMLAEYAKRLFGNGKSIPVAPSTRKRASAARR